MITGALFFCMVTAVYDGDTLTCSSGQHVRLAAVDAPEIRKCRVGRICAPGDPQAAKRALETLALGRTLSCERTGTNWYRVVAFCHVMGPDLSCALYRGGYAVRVEKYDRKKRLCK